MLISPAMSVLFQALHKAARDYRSQQAPVLVPLLSFRPAFSLRKRVLFFSVLAAFLFGVMSLLSLYGGEVAVAKEGMGPQVALVALPVKASVPLKNARKMQEDEPLGIALSEGSQSSEIQDQAARVTAAPIAKKSVLIAVTKAEKKAEKDEDDAGGDPLSRARQAAQKGSWDTALKLYGMVLKKDPKNQAALQGKVAVLSQRGGDEDLEALDALAEKAPSMASLHAARARILVRQKDTIEALTAWQKAVALDPQNKDYRLGLAILNDKLGRQSEALKLYRAIPKPLPPEAQRRLDYLASHEASSSVDGASESEE